MAFISMAVPFNNGNIRPVLSNDYHEVNNTDIHIENTRLDKFKKFILNLLQLILISILILLTSTTYSGEKTTHFITFTFVILGSYLTYLIYNITSTFWVELKTKVIMNILYGLLFILIGTAEIFNFHADTQLGLNNLNKYSYMKLFSGLLKICFGTLFNVKILLKLYKER